ncbi:acyl-CoA dehydrogenase family protein [Amycolatopsis thermophila]|uniref:Alkylation response protein AidB-like acyl-CoA dehydrogenase n=1 Tax=Amycolatopsis thermophila TaxID=206084 RepID=A0ABU0F0L3_9PSEU|nr:acyl-CoA dehydrogenase family protein [Amycolatopsis thermophila]MDQ0381108.1 alkylation response protein AidB-like acyl-CoA dehydrogenase [Amycolatopsis thermophila]
MEPTLDDEAAHWRDLARTVAAERFAPLAGELDREQRYPGEHIATVVETGLSGMLVPAEYDGRALSMTAITTVIEEISAACASTGALLAARTLGAVPARLAGTEEQRRAVLGALTDGSAISFALTEEGAGSDAAAIRTRVEADGDAHRPTGEKIYIGNGGVSSRYVVFAKTDPGADAPGVTIDRIEDKMGIRGTRTSNLELDGVRVAAGAVPGEVGRGLKLALQTLDLGRVSVAAQGLGIAHAAYRLAVAEATGRHAFGTPLIDNQGIGFRLADLAVELSAARMLTYEAARAYDAGQPVSVPGSMAKRYTSEVAHRAVDLAVRVFGGAGFRKPCPAERPYRDQRVLEIYEGSSEIQRLVPARTITAGA